MAEELLGTGKNIQAGGFFQTRQVSFAIGTYRLGMLLEQTDGVYAPLTTGTMAGVYMGDDTRILSVAGFDTAVVGGEICHSGLVDAAGDALTLTITQIAAFAPLGFYIKEV